MASSVSAVLPVCSAKAELKNFAVADEPLVEEPLVEEPFDGLEPLDVELVDEAEVPDEPDEPDVLAALGEGAVGAKVLLPVPNPKFAA